MPSHSYNLTLYLLQAIKKQKQYDAFVSNLVEKMTVDMRSEQETTIETSNTVLKVLSMDSSNALKLQDLGGAVSIRISLNNPNDTNGQVVTVKDMLLIFISVVTFHIAISPQS